MILMKVFFIALNFFTFTFQASAVTSTFVLVPESGVISSWLSPNIFRIFNFISRPSWPFNRRRHRRSSFISDSYFSFQSFVSNSDTANSTGALLSNEENRVIRPKSYLDFDFEVEEVVDQETQKICEICFSPVNLSDCLQCCKNSHFLHSACFQKIICLPCDYQRKCPICRDELISSIDELLELIIYTDPESGLWKIIQSHLIIFKLIDPNLISSFNWIEIFREIVLRGRTAHLELFLQLDVVDINCTFDDGLCAISVLLDTIYVYDAVESTNFFVIRLLNNLKFLLDHPKIILNRTVPQTNLHLIYYSIDANLFNVFVQILDASPQLNLSEILRYICEIPDSNCFFYYLLNYKDFDIFEPNEFEGSALDISIRQKNYIYALVLFNLYNREQL